jgi:hypothetical protein
MLVVLIAVGCKGGTKPGAGSAGSAAAGSGSGSAAAAPLEQLFARGYGRVVGGVVAIELYPDIHQAYGPWAYASVAGRWIVPPREARALDPVGQRGWFAFEGVTTALELYDLDSGALLVRLADVGVYHVFPNGAALVDKVDAATKQPRYGVVGRDGKWLAEARYTDPDTQHGGAFVLAKEGGQERWLGPGGLLAGPPPAPPASAPPPDASLPAADGGLGFTKQDGIVVCKRTDAQGASVETPLDKEIEGVKAVHGDYLIVTQQRAAWEACGYVDASCKPIIEPDDLTECEPFDTHGIARVTRMVHADCFDGGARPGCEGNYRYLLIDRSGKRLTAEYDKLERFGAGWWRAEDVNDSGPGVPESSRKGLLRADGKLVFPVEFNELEDAGEGWYKVADHRGRTLLNVDGRKLALPPLPTAAGPAPAP